MRMFKAALAGAAGSLLMFLLMMVGIKGLHVAPFNVPPSAAFLIKLGITAKPLALLVHFGYGMFWSAVLVAIFGERTDIPKALGLAGSLWLFMMIVYSPLIGWGVFGVGGAGHLLPPGSPLHLGPAPKYIVATLLLHVVYGLTIGWLDAKIVAGPVR
ncbi:MAG: hypothetical protein KGL53_05920 [Elusimicrobia bacterium]|nr:hypothetical protein [Elusimicrobiota bacterium]